MIKNLIDAAVEWNAARCLELSHRDGPYWKESRLRLDKAETDLAMAVASYEDRKNLRGEIS